MQQLVCTVIGMGPGVSLAVAKRFAQAGFSIAMIARNEAKLNEYAAQVQNAKVYGSDAADQPHLQWTLRAIHDQMGPTSVLVYNASSSHAGTPSNVGPEDLIEDFKVNVAAALVAVKEVIPAMKINGRGTILLTGGGLALRPATPYASLSIGKAGLRSLSYTLAGELERFGIHVATVTICGYVQPGTHFDPARIAEVYFRLYQQPRAEWEREVVYE